MMLISSRHAHHSTAHLILQVQAAAVTRSSRELDLLHHLILLLLLLVPHHLISGRVRLPLGGRCIDAITTSVATRTVVAVASLDLSYLVLLTIQK